MHTEEIMPHIRLCAEETARFKTRRISVSLALPLQKERAAAHAVLPFLLHRCCAEYPSPLALNRRLAELYGAYLSADVYKQGETQVLQIAVTILDDRFALQGEALSQEGASLLLNLLFDPPLESGLLSKTDLEREKRLLCEKIDSETNEKRIYALKRWEHYMFKNERYGVDRLGTRAEVEALTPADITVAWQNYLQNARIQINCIGGKAEAVRDLFAARFSAVGRQTPPSLQTEIIRQAKTVQNVAETLPINQGKLILGYRTGVAYPDSDYIATRVMTDCFGGGPYSSLFKEVRENLSLCYYCSARYLPMKGVMMVQSGIENENKERAIEAIEKELTGLQQGQLSPEQFSASRLGLSDSVRGVLDDPGQMDHWLTQQMLYDTPLAPEDYIAAIDKVTPQDIQQAAQKVSLDTIYMLKSEGEGK